MTNEDNSNTQAIERIEGTTRLNSAWSGNEIDTTQAKTASSIIFEQIYRPWNGKLRGRWVRNFSIWRHHVYGLFSSGHKSWSLIARILILLLSIMASYNLLIVFIGSISGSSEFIDYASIKRRTLFNQVLGYFPRNAICFPLIAALLAGGMISEDRRFGQSAIYFSRPISRIDYAAMKYLSMASILTIVIIGVLTSYYMGTIALTGEGWNFVIETFPLYVAALFSGLILIITYTSIAMALSAVSNGRYLPGVALIALLVGTRILASIIENVFGRTTLYILSPYDVVAHVSQILMGIPSDYTHSWTLSLVSLIAINVVSIYVLAVRIASMEVTRE